MTKELGALVAVRIDQDTRLAAEALAKELGVTFSGIIRLALETYLKEKSSAKPKLMT